MGDITDRGRESRGQTGVEGKELKVSGLSNGPTPGGESGLGNQWVSGTDNGALYWAVPKKRWRHSVVCFPAVDLAPKS